MNVIVYHTTNCAFCKTEMQWLDSKGIKYTHVNIEEEPDKNPGYQAVPVTVIDGNEIRGFDRKALSKALNLED